METAIPSSFMSALQHKVLIENFDDDVYALSFTLPKSAHARVDEALRSGW